MYDEEKREEIKELFEQETAKRQEDLEAQALKEWEEKKKKEEEEAAKEAA